MKYQLNLTALSCPIPLLTAKKALANLAPNDELVLQLNRQSAVENFVVFCEENQCELVEKHNGSTKPNVHVIYFRDLRFNFLFYDLPSTSET